MAKKRKIILYIVLVIAIILICKLAYFEIFKTCGDCGRQIIKEEQRIKISLAENKTAIITVDAVGNLNLDLGQNQSTDTARLERAAVEIIKRPALKLIAENEEAINGKKALVMKEISVLKTDSAYIYAIREILTKKFGFKAEIEK